MSVDTNKQIIRAIYAALEQGDRSVFGMAIDPECVWRFPSKASWSRRYQGQASIRADLLGPLYSRFTSTYRASLISLFGEGDTIVAEVQGDVETKSGVRYDNQYCFLFSFKNDKIVEIVEYCDTDLEERALGLYADAVKEYEAATDAGAMRMPLQT